MTNKPFLALITPLTGEGLPHPDQGLPMPQPPFPAQPPLGIWGPTDPRPGYGLPGSQPRPDNTLPGSQPHPDQGLPGSQPRPDHGLPPFPSHPIYFPPAGGQPPLGIWGPTDPRPGYGLPGEQPKPTHPIVIPPDLPAEIPDLGPVSWKPAWTAQTGWVIIGIPNEGVNVPTPSKTTSPGSAGTPPKPPQR